MVPSYIEDHKFRASRQRSSSRGSCAVNRLPSVERCEKPKSKQSAFDMVVGLLGRRRCSSNVSECSTRCPSELDSSDGEPESPIFLPSMSEAGVIIFDWDDTLFPTSWLRACTRGRSATAKLPLVQLKEHARLIEDTLRSARAVAKVAIVTLAKRGWVSNVSREYLPGLDVESLFAELAIEVHYAREEPCPGAFDAGEYETLKRSAMQRVLMQHCTQNDGCQSALSIGDDTIEEEAMQGLDIRCFDKFSQCPVRKTLKFMDDPSLPQLGEELRRLCPLLKPLARRARGFKIRVRTPKDINAVNLQ